MRGQPRSLVRRSVAAAAALLLSCTLVSCSEDDVSTRQPGRNIEPTPAAANDAALTQVASTTGLGAPEWMPPSLPVPEGASVTAVGNGACTVNFLVPTPDAQVVGGNVGARARANGLDVELVSSVSQTEVVPEQDMEVGLFEEDAAPVKPVVTHVVVLRLRGAAVRKKTPAVDATLTLTSRGDEFVTGEYAVAAGTCGR